MKAASKEPGKPVVEDESIKKNTDCVYFLASPLTCKKGNDCEYRHSEEARMNPRDCWFWLNGNCLNPKCAFRHPPLDGLVGTPLATSVKPAILPVVSAQLPVVKQATPCYYFQKGQCLKGDRCAFMHGSLPPTDRVLPHQPSQKTTPDIEPQQVVQKHQWSLEHCNQQRNVVKAGGVQTFLRPPVKNVGASTNEIVPRKSMPSVSQNCDTLSYKAGNAPSTISGNFASRTQSAPQIHALYDRNFLNDLEPGEILGKTPSGFDDPTDAQLRKSRGDVGRKLNTVNVDYGRSTEYGPATKFHQESYSDLQGYDTYEKVQDRFVQEPRPYLSESRGYSKVESREQIDELDLRQRLSKQRRTNGPKSDVSPYSHGDLHKRVEHVRYVEDQRYQGHLRGDSRYSHQESSRRSRLQGRISLPGRSLSDSNQNNFDAQDRERRRSSPVRALQSSFTGMPLDSIRPRVGDELTAEERRFRTPLIRRDDIDDFNFSGTKRLTELKSLQELDDSISFESPKPLREILKRKREGKIVLDDETAYGGREGEYQKEREGNSLTVVSDKQSDNPSDIKEDMNDRDNSKKEQRLDGINPNGTLVDEDEEEEEGLITEEIEDQLSAQRENELEAEETMVLDNAEDGDYETFDQKAGESDFDQVDGDFNSEEYGYPDLELEEEDDEEECDDDGDDFAKRIGVMFS